MPSLLRSWREWSGRWFSAPPVFDFSYEVQPVVLVDDVRKLSVPPVVIRQCAGATVAGVVGQDSTFLLIPQRFPIAIEEFLATAASGTIAWGTQAIPAPVLLNLGAPARIEGSNAIAADSQFWYGPTGTFLLTGDEGGASLTGARLVRFDPPVIVMPGQFFFWQPSATNLTVTMERVIWGELPDLDARTSQPRT